MPAFAEIARLVVFFGTALAFLIAALEVIPRRRTAAVGLFSAMLATVGLLQLWLFLEIQGGFGARMFPYAIYLPPPLIALLGFAIASEDFQLRPKHLIFFLPAAIACAAGIVGVPARWLLAAAPVHAILMISPLFVLFAAVRKTLVRLLLAIFIVDTVTVSLLFEAGIFINREYWLWAGCIVTSVLCLVMGLRMHSPGWLREVREQVTAAKYARSKLAGLDMDFLARKLQWIMENDRLYTRDDLSLALLAQNLSLTPHQLSELINRRFGLGYFAFVNRYRIEEAKRLLAEPGENILAIAMAVGFSNKSSFNEAFVRFSGCTPAEYRAKNLILK